MKNTQRTKMATFGFLAVATLGLSACGADAAEETTAGAAATAESEPEATEDTMAEETEGTETEGSMAGDPAADLVGPGCADYAAAVPEGPGSVVGMSQDPVAVAASNNPLLTTLVAAVSGQLNPDVNLVDTLNGGEFTVFAPVDDAFAQIDAATLESLKTDADALTSILTYHVVPGQLSPEMVVGEQTTVQGGTLEVTGEGDMLMVNDANVICGGVHTANATVYLVDGVLMPTM